MARELLRDVPLANLGLTHALRPRAGTFFARCRDIFRTCRLKSVLCGRHPLRSAAVDRKQRSAVLYRTFVTFRFILGDAHANQRANHAAGSGACSQTCKRSHYWPSGDERTDTRDSKGAYSGKQTDCSSNRATRCCSGSSALWRLGVLLVREGASALVIGQ